MSEERKYKEKIKICYWVVETFLQDYRYCLSEKKKEEVKNNFLENINEFLLEKEPDKKKTKEEIEKEVEQKIIHFLTSMCIDLKVTKNLEESELLCASRLRNDLITDLLLLWTNKHSLEKKENRTLPEDNFSVYLKNNYLEEKSLIQYSFQNDFLSFAEKFYERVGEDIRDIYDLFLEKIQKESSLLNR